MTPNFPIRVPAAPASSFDEEILSGQPLSEHGNTIRTTYKVDGDELVIRVPLNVKYSDVRRNKKVDEATGKETRSVTMVLSATAEEGTNAIVTLNQAEGIDIVMPVKPTINLNVGLNWRAREVVVAEA